MLPPKNYLATFPLLDSSALVDKRFLGNETSSSIIHTEEIIYDLALAENKHLNFSISANGFEIGEIDMTRIILPDHTKHTTNPPHTPWTSTSRPLASFVNQFKFCFSPIKLQNSYMFTISCHGELLRSATSSGQPPSNSSVKWPPTFNAHIDQDVDGEPLKSMYLSFLFKRYSPLRLVNLWFPLNDEQVRPLALLDNSKLESNTMLAKWSETTFDIISDRFIITDKAVSTKPDDKLWWYNSQLKRGQVLVFSTTNTPHTSFGRDDVGSGTRYSVEMRCVSVIIPNSVLEGLFCLMLFFVVYITRSQRLVSKFSPNNKYD